jgi:hypothetical protein
MVVSLGVFHCPEKGSIENAELLKGTFLADSMFDASCFLS